MTRAGGSDSTPSSGSVVIGGDATLKAAIVSRDGLLLRRGVEAPTRLPRGLKVVELPDERADIRPNNRCALLRVQIF